MHDQDAHIDFRNTLKWYSRPTSQELAIQGIQEDQDVYITWSYTPTNRLGTQGNQAIQAIVDI
jgi:hypothetical protein